MKRYLLFILCLLVLFQSGCKVKSEEKVADVEDENVVEVAIEDKVVIDRSEDLSDYVVELFGIDDAATIIFNDTALVSVIMAQDAEFTEDTKDIINKLVMERDSAIKEVLVSNDEKTFFQVIEIMGNLLNGTSYDSYVGTISKIIEKNK